MARQRGKRARGKKQPITRHPLFPVVIALWCGALFGLGVLAIRPTLLESIVLSSHVDTVIPMAAPPLGIRARIMLALALAAIAGSAGSMVARRIARPKPEMRQRRRGAGSAVAQEAEARRPISAHEELGEQIAPASTGGRRRPLAIAEDQGPNYHREFAPLPGGSPQILDIADMGVSDPQSPAADVVPLDLGDLTVLPEPVMVQPEQALAESAAPAAMVEPSPAPTSRPFAQPAHFADVQPAEKPSVPIERPVLQQGTPTGRLPAAEAPFAPAIPRFAEPATMPETSVSLTPTAAGEIPQPQAHAEPQRSAAAFSPPTGTSADRIAAAELGALTHVELIERLALSLQRRRGVAPATSVELDALQADAITPAPIGPAEPMARFAESEKVEIAIQPLAAAAAPAPVIAIEPVANVLPEIADLVVPPPMAMPAALRPISLDFHDEIEDDDSLLGRIPPRRIAMPTPVAEVAPAPGPAADFAAEPVIAAETVEVEEIQEEAEVHEEGYSSLLDLKNPLPAKQTFVRVDEPEEDHAIEPVVVFPGQATSWPSAAPAAVEVPQMPPPVEAASQTAGAPLRRFDAPGTAPATASAPTPGNDAAETEQALRTALAALQRMSGAA